MAKVTPVPVMLVVRSLIVAPPRNILLIRRAPGKRNEGLWEVPGGKLHSGELPQAGRQREVVDEVALTVQPVSGLMYAVERIINELPYAVLYLCLFEMAVVESGTVTLSPEHDCFVWAPYDDTGAYSLTNETALALQAMKALLPFEI